PPCYFRGLAPEFGAAGRPVALLAATPAGAARAGSRYRPRIAAPHAAVAAVRAQPAVHLRHSGKLRAQYSQPGRVPGWAARATSQFGAASR
nr:hypothetical protein [Tanacetum cinerariifolium]